MKTRSQQAGSKDTKIHVVLTGDLKFDLSAFMIYLQLMTSLENSGSAITNPEVRQVLTEIGSLVDRNDLREIEEKGPKILIMLLPLVNQLLKNCPLKVSWQQLASDFSRLCKDNKELYSYGISHDWLHQRMDCSNYRFADLPLHARIGVGPHAGRAGVEDWFLLQDAFFILAAAEASYEEMHSFARLPTSLDRNGQYDVLSVLNRSLATNSRVCVVSFMAFVEAFVNSVGHDFGRRNSTTLSDDEIELLAGFKKGKFLSIDYKLEKYPLILSKGKSKLIVRDTAQRVEPFSSLLGRFKQQRDSSMHYAPGKEPIWRKPDEWIQIARDSSRTCLEVARHFWKACYPTDDYPRYLAMLDYTMLKSEAEMRIEKLHSAKMALQKVKVEKV